MMVVDSLVQQIDHEEDEKTIFCIHFMEDKKWSQLKSISYHTVKGIGFSFLSQLW